MKRLHLLIIILIVLLVSYSKNKPVQNKIATLNQSNVRNEFKTNFVIENNFTITGNTQQIDFITIIPKSIPARQKITNIKIEPTPNKYYEADGNTYAEYTFVNPPPNISVKISGTAELYRYDYTMAVNAGNLYKVSEFLGDYLLPEKYIESDDPYIKNIASTISGNDEIEIIRNIYNFTQNTIKYKIYSGSLGALYSLQNKTGDCTEYATAMVALCRAKDIPARAIHGYYTNQKHSWVEGYTRKYGWIPFDPTPPSSFYLLDPSYFYLYNKSEDPNLHNAKYMCYREWGDPVEFSDRITFY